MTVGQIVVGVDGSLAAAAAAAWATFHSGITGRKVLLAHAKGARSVHNDQEQDGFNGVDSILAGLTASGLAAGVQIAATETDDDPASGLLRWSAAADIVAVGNPAKTPPRLLGRLSDHLAATALCPVALIRHSYRPPDAAGGPVLVGMADGPAARLALRFAAAEADLMNTAVVIVRADEEPRESNPKAARILAGINAHFPRLSITNLASPRDPAEMLVELAASAQLVVVGAHHSSDPWSIRLGPVTETVLRQVPCPVISVGRWHHAR